MVNVFTTKNAGKRYKEHFQREPNDKQGRADVFQS